MSRVTSNPFSAKNLRPGVLPYIFSRAPLSDECRFPANTEDTEDSANTDDTDATLLVDRLETLGGRAKIVGPHGSGKSTLLATIIPILKRRGATVHEIALHDKQRRLPPDFLARNDFHAEKNVWIVVDGYEQLSFPARVGLKRFCRRNRCGLLITSHRSQRSFRLLASTEAEPELAQRIVDHLLDKFPVTGPGVATDRLVSESDVLEAFQACEGDMRETLFSLYDQYEQASAECDEAGEAS